MRPGPTRVETYSSNDFLNVACWRRSKASTALSCVTPDSAWLITAGEMPAACASAEKLWMKVLNGPPQRAAKAGVVRRAATKRIASRKMRIRILPMKAFVIARSEATKQSIFQQVEIWIGLLRFARNDEERV